MQSYRRLTSDTRPCCPICGKLMIAGSTQGRITYYYPTCQCGSEGEKVVRDVQREQQRAER